MSAGVILGIALVVGLVLIVGVLSGRHVSDSGDFLSGGIRISNILMHAKEIIRPRKYHTRTRNTG